MAVTKRLTAPATGNGDDGIPIAPSGIARDTVTGLWDTAVNPAGGEVRQSTDATYKVTSGFRDARGNRVVEIDATALSGVETFTISFRVDPDPDGTYGRAGVVSSSGIFTTSALNDDDSLATIQTAVRTALPGADLTVVLGTTDAATAPFYLVFDREFYSRRYPRVSVAGSATVPVLTAGGTATAKALQEDGGGGGAAVLVPGEVRHLGESKWVSTSNSILKPTIGTITVTPGVDEVQTVAYFAGTNGGTISYGIQDLDRGEFRVTGGLAWDSTVGEVQAALADLDPSSYPTVDLQTGAEVATIDLGDIGAADTFKLTYNAVETAGTVAFDTDLADAVVMQAKVDELLGGAGKATVAQVDTNTYTVTKLSPGAFVTTFTVTSPTTFTPLGSGGYVNGGKITTAASDPIFRFTFERGKRAGRPLGLGTLVIYDGQLTATGTLKAATLVVGTAGVLGSISAAYTENGAGDSVLAAAINDATGESKGFVLDVASPVAVSGLVPGAHHLVLRTVEAGRVSKADNKAFTMTSS